MTIIERLGELQEEYFQKSGKLYKYAELLGPLYEYMTKDVLNVYKKESELFLREAALEQKEKDYELTCKEDKLMPARRGLFRRRRNKPADIIYREVWTKAEEMFNRRTAALERLEAALKESSKKFRLDEESNAEDEGNELTQDKNDELETAASQLLFAEIADSRPAQNEESDKDG